MGQSFASLCRRNKDAPHENKHEYDTHRRVTGRQLFYLTILQGVGAAFIAAVINFAIACLTYRTTHKRQIRIWPIRETVAGDMGLTVIIQSILTLLITVPLVRADIRAGRIQPFSFSFPNVRLWSGTSENKSISTRYIARVLNFLSPAQTLSFRQTFREFATSLLIMVFRGFIISIPYFLIFWPIAIAIVAPIYGGEGLRGSWKPEIIKLLFGGILGFFLNPFIAALALGAHPTSSGAKDIESGINAPAGRESTEPITQMAPPDVAQARIATTTPVANSALNTEKGVMQQEPQTSPVSIQDPQSTPTDESDLSVPPVAHVKSLS
ncbi:hypothetical protein K439DRAFT_1659269 [Ramaria rubella]|nr:hypothetical protein K439DRAFT_1659269 [Ramaria rubella]